MKQVSSEVWRPGLKPVCPVNGLTVWVSDFAEYTASVEVGVPISWGNQFLIHFCSKLAFFVGPLSNVTGWIRSDVITTTGNTAWQATLRHPSVPAPIWHLVMSLIQPPHLSFISPLCWAFYLNSHLLCNCHKSPIHHGPSLRNFSLIPPFVTQSVHAVLNQSIQSTLIIKVSVRHWHHPLRSVEDRGTLSSTHPLTDTHTVTLGLGCDHTLNYFLLRGREDKNTAKNRIVIRVCLMESINHISQSVS